MLQSFHKTAHTPKEAAWQALSAGLDVEASSNCYPELIEGFYSGELNISVLDEAVARVLYAKFKMGLFEDPYGNKYTNATMHTPQSIALSREIADESTVLLKNENNFLPLDRSKMKSIAVIGPNADQVQFGDYTWTRDNKDGVTPLEGIRNLVGNDIQVNYAKGCSMMSLDTSEIAEAVEVAKKSDVAVLFCGSASAALARDYKSTNCGEGFDLHDLNLTGAQGQLIKEVYATGTPVVLVLVAGKPFVLNWEKQHIPAILTQWYAGEQAGASIADILFGEIYPSGRLTFSFPQSTGHLPVYYDHLPSDRGFYKNPGSYDSPAPVKAVEREVKPEEEGFSGFVFKIHANMDPNHRSCIAFVKICSGKFERNVNYKHVRNNKLMRFSSPTAFMAQKKEVVDEAFAGDIVGLPDTGNFKIGDTLTGGEMLHVKGIPSFSTEYLIIQNDADYILKCILQMHTTYYKTIYTTKQCIW